MLEKILPLLINFGHGSGVFQQNVSTLEGDLSSWSLRMVVAASVALLVLMGIAVLTSNKTDRFKLPLFITMSFIMVGSTLMLAASTIYLNVVSDSGGPVHWHADIEYWVCDNEIEPINPVGFSNKIGSGSIHEHNDGRIHVEGVVINAKTDASLGRYMDVVGGEITKTSLFIPVNPDGSVFTKTTDGDGPSNPYPDAVDNLLTVKNGIRYIEANNGQSCNGEPAEVQVFVYKFNKAYNTYKQTKLRDPASYTLSPETTVPPGDCIIVEFSPLRAKTNKLCEQYGTRDANRCLSFGVDPKKANLCTIKQTNYTPIGTGSDPNFNRSLQ